MTSVSKGQPIALKTATALALVLAVVAIPKANAQSAPAAPPQIELKRLSDHMRILSSDAFEGRAPGTEGEKKTIAYITKQLAGLGLKPAGDQGGWTQAVPMRRFETQGPIRAGFDLDGKARPVQNLEDIVLNSRSGDAKIALANAPVVFIGFGTAAPERKWDDFKGYDLRGKVAVVLVNDPDNGLPESDPIYGRFDGPLQTYYGRWTYKMEEATRRGAAGILVVQEDGPAGYGWNTTRNSNSAPQFEIASEGHKTLDTKVRGWVKRDVAAEIFKAAGRDFDAEKRRAQSQDFTPVELKGVRFSADFAVKYSTIVSHNILGKLPGAKHPDETVIWMAHWDHLGIGTPDARGDRIYNGANDNASGSATLLELARLYATRPRTERTVQFLFTTAEEKGILGAEYYVTHPVAPLEKTVAVINFDGANMKGVAKDISSRGGPNSPLDPLLAKEAEKAGRKFTPDQWLAQAYFFRADQFPFAKYGVPGIAYASGLDLEKGGRAAGEAWAANFLATRYHMPSDEWSPDLNLEGAVVDTAVYDSLGQTLANSRIWPEWPETSPFKAIRDKSASLRPGGGQ